MDKDKNNREESKIQKDKEYEEDLSREEDSETVSEEEDINSPLKQEEILEAIKKIKKGKAAGEDGITVEFLSGMPEEGLKEFIELIQDLWKEEKLIENWRIANIFTIHKKGDENLTTNYRGISLLDVGYKILAIIMAKRLGKWLEKEEKLTEAQGGFRSGRGPIDQVFVLNTLIGNRLRKKRGKLYTAFIDFKKAFDLVDREILWRKMNQMGLKGKMVDMIKEIYKETSNEILMKEEKTDRFFTNKGVRQGCPLSPILFNIYINDLDDEIRKKGEGGTALNSNTKIFTLIYADDLVLVAENGEDLNRMLKSLQKWTDKNKMEVNISKSKIMIFRNGGKRKAENWKYKEEELEVVGEFNYLGFWFSTRNRYSLHVNKAAGKTQQLINKVWGETRRAGITNLKQKLYFMDSTVKAAAMYGVELWGWRRREVIERIQSRYVKSSMGLSKNTPDYVWKMEAGRESVEIQARKRAGSFLDKINKHEGEQMAKEMFERGSKKHS